MSRFPPIRGVLFLVLTAVVATGCSDAVLDPTGPTVIGQAVWGPSISADPTVLTPEFLHSEACASARPFNVRFNLLLTAGRRDPLVFRSIDFRFTDRLGVQSIPGAELLPVPQLGQSTLPSSSPVPIPLPGQSATILVNAGTVGRLPFALRFGCGVRPDGVMRITVGTMTGGRPDTTELAIRIAG